MPGTNAEMAARTSAPIFGSMDYYFRIYETLFLQPPRIHQSMMVETEEHVSLPFDPDPVIDHCFQQFKQKDFQLPACRRRIIILPRREEPVPPDPTLPPPAPPPPIPSFKALEDGDLQKQPEDTTTWLNRRLKLRKELETFGDLKKWLDNKPSITPSEAKVLHEIQEEEEVQRGLSVQFQKATGRKSLGVSHRLESQIWLPKPSALSHLFSYLHACKIKFLDLFHKTDQNWKQRISGEDFIMTLKAARVPLSTQDMEEIVIYLSSLGKHNTITMEILVNAYKQWFLAQQSSALYGGSEMPKMDTDTEAWPMTLEELEKVEKPYRERKLQRKYTQPRHLGLGGKEPFHQRYHRCLLATPTVPGDLEELINMAHRDAFLVYLQCWKLCEAYGLPLTEDILMRALLYPGDKIIFRKDKVPQIRQPGGFYSDWKIAPKPADSRGLKRPEAKRKSFKRAKKMRFDDFERFTRKLQKKSHTSSQTTHPNSFWPGHLLDKLRLYLPIVAKDSSLALFSCVKRERHVYPATYHPNRWWPMRDTSYMTRAHYDSNKVYYIN